VVAYLDGTVVLYDRYRGGDRFDVDGGCVVAAVAPSMATTAATVKSPVANVDGGDDCSGGKIKTTLHRPED